MSSTDLERAELDRVIDLLGRTTRPARLLAFIGSRHFAPGQQLSEFSIATEVFGRSTKNFDSTEDAVVRVEAHRLRKKLREIYEKGQGPHGIQISVPAGSYVLKFLPATEPHPVEAEHAEPVGKAGGGEQPAHETAAASSRGRRWPYLVALAGVLAAIIALWLIRGPQITATGVADGETPKTTGSVAPPAGAVSEVHILSGYTGSEVIDNSGVKWTPDRFFDGGAGWPKTTPYIRGTSRQFLFAAERTGQFSYDIPLVPGTYEMRLFFVSPSRVGDEKVLSYNVTLNDQTLLTGYDANISAGGADVADEKVYRDVTPGPDGHVHLSFYNVTGTPEINALELVPGEPGRLKPIRITTQATRNHVTKIDARTDPRGNAYYWIEEALDEYHPDSGRSDHEAVKAGYVSVTPLQPDMTAYDILDHLGPHFK